MTITTTATNHTTSAGLCPDCGYVIAVEGTARGARCPNCNAGVRLTWVVGKHNKATPCDDRCQYAILAYCSCSCGGVNHRRGYIDVEMVPAWIRERDAQRHDAKVARKEAKKTREAKAKADRTAELLEAYPELADLESDRYADDCGFMCDMKWALRHGTMTDAQLAAALRAIARDREYDARKVVEAAAAAVLAASGVHVPTGRVQFTGHIENVRLEPGFHGRSVWKMLVSTAEGWRVWGTMPQSLVEANPYSDGTNAGYRSGEAYRASFRGRAVKVTATLEQSPDDALFGFAKNPVAAFVG